MKKLAVITTISILTLAACGGGSKGNNDYSNDADTREISISGKNSTQTIEKSSKNEQIALIVSGIGHTLDIKSDLESLTISGQNNTFNFSENITVKKCEINGLNNTANLSKNVSISCTITGSGNTGFSK